MIKIGRTVWPMSVNEIMDVNEAKKALGIFTSKKVEEFNAEFERYKNLQRKISFLAKCVVLMDTGWRVLERNVTLRDYNDFFPMKKYMTSAYSTNFSIDIFDIQCLPWTFIIKGEQLKIKMALPAHDKSIEKIIDIPGKNMPQMRGADYDVEMRNMVKILIKDHNSHIAQLFIDQPFNVLVNIENISPFDNLARQTMHAEILSPPDPKKLMNEMFIDTTEDSWYRMCAVKKAIHHLRRKESRVRMINLIYNTKVPVSRSAMAVYNILRQMPCSYFGFLSVEEAEDFITQVRYNRIDNVKNTLIKTGCHTPDPPTPERWR